MSNSIKINVNPNPIGEFDFNLPFVGLIYDVGTYEQRVKDIAGNAHIILTNNGESPQRLELAHKALSGAGLSVSMEPLPPCYVKKDMLFEDREYKVLPYQISGKQELVDFYIDNYQSLPYITKEYNTPDQTRGFFKKRNLIWYQYGRGMPPNDNHPGHIELYQQFENIFQSTVIALHKVTGWSAKMIEDQLLIRMNHNEPASWFNDTYRTQSDQYFIPRHLDTTIITGWIYTSHPGAVVETNNTPVAIEELHNPNTEMLLMPGMDYSDATETMKDATWHAVKDCTEKEHRISIVAFLKRPVDH
jgi:hypothetical protein